MSSCCSSESSDALERMDAVFDSIKELEQSCSFQYMGELGKGTYGDVLKMYDVKSDTYKAAKVIIPRNICENEILMWSKLNHKNVVAAEEVTILPEGTVIVIMPLQFTTMCELLSDKRFNLHPKSVEFARRWLQESLEGLQYMHDNNVCHLDLKLDNVLISHSGTAMICDFSFAYNALSTLTEDKVGVPDLYRPPELFKRSRRTLCGKAIDIWCYGMMVVETFTGECLLDRILMCKSWQRDVKPMLTLVLYPAVFGALVADHFPNCSFRINDLQDVMSFIDGFLRIKPSNRCSSSEAICHPFINDSNAIRTNLREIYSSNELERDYMFTTSQKKSRRRSASMETMTILSPNQSNVTNLQTSTSEPSATKIHDTPSMQSISFSLHLNDKKDPKIGNIQCFFKPQNLDDIQEDRRSSPHRNENDLSVQDSRPLRFTLNKVKDDHYLNKTKQEQKSGHQESQSFTSWVRHKWKDFKKWFGWKKSPAS